MVIRSLTIFVDLVLLFVYCQFVFVFLYLLIYIFISWKQFVNVFLFPDHRLNKLLKKDMTASHIACRGGKVTNTCCCGQFYVF